MNALLCMLVAWAAKDGDAAVDAVPFGEEGKMTDFQRKYKEVVADLEGKKEAALAKLKLTKLLPESFTEKGSSAEDVHDQKNQPRADTASTSDSNAEMEAEFADDPKVQTPSSFVEASRPSFAEFDAWMKDHEEDTRRAEERGADALKALTFSSSFLERGDKYPIEDLSGEVASLKQNAKKFRLSDSVNNFLGSSEFQDFAKEPLDDLSQKNADLTQATEKLNSVHPVQLLKAFTMPSTSLVERRSGDPLGDLSSNIAALKHSLETFGYAKAHHQKTEANSNASSFLGETTSDQNMTDFINKTLMAAIHDNLTSLRQKASASIADAESRNWTAAGIAALANRSNATSLLEEGAHADATAGAAAEQRMQQKLHASLAGLLRASQDIQGLAKIKDITARPLSFAEAGAQEPEDPDDAADEQSAREQKAAAYLRSRAALRKKIAAEKDRYLAAQQKAQDAAEQNLKQAEGLAETLLTSSSADEKAEQKALRDSHLQPPDIPFPDSFLQTDHRPARRSLAQRRPRYDSGGEHKQNRIYDRLEALEEKAESMKENLQLSARKFTEGEKAMRAELPSWVRHRHRRESFLETDSPPEGAEIPEVTSQAILRP